MQLEQYDPWLPRFAQTEEICAVVPRRDRIESWDVPGKLPSAPASSDEWIATRLRKAAVILRDCVIIDADVRGGIPVLMGTRFSIAQVLAEIADGKGICDIAQEFDLDENLLRRLFEGLSIHLDRPSVR